MKSIAIAAALATAALTVPAVALAQAPASAPAAGGLSVEKTPIQDLIKNEQAKAIIEKALPPISQFYDQIGAMTLAQVAPMSQGALDDAKLKEIQAEFDKLK
jgi:hypothetical protein